MASAENKIQLDIIKYLLKQGHFCWRNNNGAVWDAKNQTYRSNIYTPRGLPDILLIHKEKYGQLWGLEVKTKKGRASADQLLTQSRFHLNNAEYHIVRSVDEVRALGL